MSRRVKVSKLKEAIRALVLQELNEQENDKPEHFGGGENIDILGFQTEHFDICRSAVILYQKLMVLVFPNLSVLKYTSLV